MPRDPDNNPTERIERLLWELEALSDAYDLLWRFLSERVGTMGLPNKPSLVEFEKEKIRQKFTNKRTKYIRHHMQRARLLGNEAGLPHVRSMKEAREALIARDSEPLQFDDNAPTGSEDDVQKLLDRLKEKDGL